MTTSPNTPLMSNKTDYLASEHWPRYEENEISSVVEILRSGKVNQWTGSYVREFEQKYNDYLGSGHSIAVANGSLALELALHAFGITKGDEVIVTPRTFVASAYCVRLVGATPIFTEIDEHSGNITAESIEKVITPKTKAVIPVHLGGWPCDMPKIMDVAKKHNLIVIEDCAQAHGATIDGKPVGTFGDAAAFSFCQDKIITTGGEGGMTVFQDYEKYKWAWSYKDHGKSFDKMHDPNPPKGFRYVHDAIGTNWRMMEISAAIGMSQLARLDETLRDRTERAEVFANAIEGISGIQVFRPESSTIHAYYRFYFYLDSSINNTKAVRDEIISQCSQAGIRIFSGSSSEVYRESGFSDMTIENYPISASVGDRSFALEVHPNLDLERTKARAVQISKIIKDILED